MSRCTLGLPPKLLALFSAVALSACGGGGGGGGGGSSGGGSGGEATGLETGVYDMEAQFPDDTSRNDLIGLVGPGDQFIFFDPFAINTRPALTRVDLEFGASSAISGTGVTVAYDGSDWSSDEGGVAGTLNSRENARLRVLADDSANETVLDLVRSNEFSDQGLNMAELSAIYTSTGVTFTINGNGDLTGTKVEGNCSFAGTVTIPNSSVNVYELTFTAGCSSAPELSGQFSGLGTFFPATDDDAGGILFATTDGETVVNFAGSRN